MPHLPMNTRLVIMAVCVALTIALWFLTGCANPAAAVYPSIVAADAATLSGTSLVKAGTINAATAGKLSTDLHVADAVFKNMVASIQAGQPPLATDAAAALTALQAIAADLQTTPQGKAIGARLAARKATPGAKSITPGEVITIITLAEELTPVIIQAVNEIFGNPGPTVADCQTALAKFEADLTALDAAVAGH
jgi:hypothetical protein